MSAPIAISAVVLNLKRSKGRRIQMEKQLKDKGLNYRFFEAVDGQSLTKEEYDLCDEKAVMHRIGRPMLPGEIGAALSHIKVYEWMIQQNLPRLLVLEDDSCFKSEFFDALRCIDTWLPKDWNMVNFTLTEMVPYNQNAPEVGPKLYPLPFLSNAYLIKCLYPHRCACCYMITLSAAKRLLRFAYPVRLFADDLTGYVHMHKLHSYTTMPALCYTQGKSVILDEKKRRRLKRQKLSIRRVLLIWVIPRFIHQLRVIPQYLYLGYRYPLSRKEWALRLRRSLGGLPQRIKHSLFKLVARIKPL